ncbi:hypothetical protein C0U43_28630, partial [Klebsiella pneumoniae]
LKTGARRACSGCCANRPQTGGATAPAWSDGHHGAHAVALHITPLALLDVKNWRQARLQRLLRK